MSINAFQVSSELNIMIWLKSLPAILQNVTLKSNVSFVSVTKEVGVPEDLEVRSCKRFFRCVLTEGKSAQYGTSKSESCCIFSYHFGYQKLVPGREKKWPHDRWTRSRAGHQSTAAAHGVDPLDLPRPFDTLYSSSLPNEVLFPAAPPVFQHHFSVLSNTHIFTFTD